MKPVILLLVNFIYFTRYSLKISLSDSISLCCLSQALIVNLNQARKNYKFQLLFARGIPRSLSNFVIMPPFMLSNWFFIGLVHVSHCSPFEDNAAQGLLLYALIGSLFQRPGNEYGMFCTGVLCVSIIWLNMISVVVVWCMLLVHNLLRDTLKCDTSVMGLFSCRMQKVQLAIIKKTLNLVCHYMNILFQKKIILLLNYLKLFEKCGIWTAFRNSCKTHIFIERRNLFWTLWLPIFDPNLR